MAVIATPPKLQFFDANGNPLVGGKLYSYAAGTVTPLATYTDSSGATPNANPIILDSRGEASVWLGTALYKFALYTSTNVLVWTVDNVGGFATLAELAASSGSSLIGFLQSGANAQARTVQSKLRDVVSVKDFGAVGDGLTDDTTAIQNALNTGKLVTGVPGETYVISSTLSLSVAGTQFDGAGCAIKVTSATISGTIYQGQLFSILADRVVLSNFVIPYNSSAKYTPTVDGNGMPVNRYAIVIGANNCLVTGVRIVNSRAGTTSTWNGGIGLSGANADNNEISNNTLIQVASGIRYCPESYSGNGNRVLRNWLEDCFYTIQSGDPVGNSSIGNVVEENFLKWTTYTCYMGVEDYSSGSRNVIGTRIVRNTFLGNSSSIPSYYAISAISRNTVIDGNIITDWYPSLATGTAGIEVNADSGSIVTNNVIRWTNTPEGVAGTGRLGIVSSGDNASGANSIIGNKFENANYGIWIHPGASNTNTMIQGNTFRGCARSIYCDGPASNLSIVSNVIEITRPQTAARNLIDIVTCRAEIVGNIIEFEAASSQNTYTTTVIHVAGDNVTIANNFGNCGGYSFLAEVIAIWTAGSTPTNCLVTNNTFIGGMGCYYDGFTKVQGFGNVVPLGVHGVTNNKLSFYDGQSPVVQPTGYGTPTNVSKTSSLPGTTATLAQVGGTLAALIADLKSQNLIGS